MARVRAAEAFRASVQAPCRPRDARGVQPCLALGGGVQDLAGQAGRPDFLIDVRELREGLLNQELSELGIRAEHLFRVAALPWVHRNPFDRLLVAQAMEEGLVLLTADRTLKRYGKAVQVA